MSDTSTPSSSADLGIAPLLESPAICVFCGSRRGSDPEFAEVARQVGASIAKRGWTLVYGGGRVGLMGTVADAALAEGGQVIGIIPEFMDRHEIAHREVSQLEIVPDMHRRKALLVQKSNAVLTLPGGVGTYEEFFEVLSWSQLGLYDHPLGLLNVRGCFDPLLNLFNQSVEDGFLKETTADHVLIDSDGERILDRLAAAWKRPGSANPRSVGPTELVDRLRSS